MDPIKARLISKGKGTAEVVTYLGKGAEKRSITMHLRVGRDGRWTGPNPDKTAVARLDAAERVEAGAEETLNRFNVKIAEVGVAILLLKKQKKEGVVDQKQYGKERRVLGRLRKETTLKLAAALLISLAATKAADEVRAEVTRYPEFVF